MSFPPGTEMFQFPGFAPPHYGFMRRYPCGWVAPFGYPRIEACSRLPVAFRSVPRPSSPPGAKASTECPSYAQDHSRHIAQYNDYSPHQTRAVELLLSTQQSPLNTIAVRWSYFPITRSRHPVRLTQTAAPRDAPKPDSPCQNITPHLLSDRTSPK